MNRSILIVPAVVALSSTALSQSLLPQPRMGQPVPGLSAAELARFEAGKLAFELPISVAEGRGPIFNDNSCDHCHLSPATGGFSLKSVTRFGTTDMLGNFDPLANLGGSLLQFQSIDDANCLETVPPEATVTALRITPPAFGAGLVQGIPDADIEANAITPPSGIGTVSGIAHKFPIPEDPSGNLHVGRFGWKAQDATMLDFSGGASMNELGLTNYLNPTDSAPNGDASKLLICDTVADPEDVQDGEGFFKIERMEDFQRMLAAPPQTPKSGMIGETIFGNIGCAQCHVPSWTSGTVADIPALSGQTIKPFSDFLLHDMGALGDGIVQGAGTEQEMKTSPLWGMVSRTGYLHDGRATGGLFADNVATAVDHHLGEAAASRAAWLALSQADKDALARFLQSLGRGEFDNDIDNDVDEFDWFIIESMVTGPAAGTYTPDDDEAFADADQDGDIDLADWAVMQRAFGGV
jgi:CxxC motif-containing protein (DUF1111 family)